MGFDTRINIGPYLIVKGKKIEYLDREVRTCTNKSCETHKTNQRYSENQKFCADCGHEVGIKKYKEEWVSGPWKLITDEPYEEFIDELAHAFQLKDNEDVFIPNQKTPFDKKRGRLSEYEDGMIDLTNASPQEEIAWFEKRYEKILDTFKNEFGPDSYKIKWGAVQWNS